MTDNTAPPTGECRTRLAMLAMHLGVHALDAEHVGDMITARNRDTGRTITITCHPRAEDGGALWFWADQRHPLGNATITTDAIVAVKGLLAHPAAEPNEGSGAAAPVIGALTRAVQAAEQVGARYNQPPGEVLRAALRAMQPREVQELRGAAALLLAVADELLAVRP